MATVAGDLRDRIARPDYLSGTPRAAALDRWIYVLTAAFFIAITLTGFIPDSIEKIHAVRSGERPPFPMVMHLHAVLMGTFLLLLLAQTTLVAIGRCSLHRKIGIAAFVLAPILVLVGIDLAATNYHIAWNAAMNAPPAARSELQQIVLRRDNIMLMQLRIGFLFSLFLIIGLRARGRNAGLHKRMMILATAAALPAAIDRIEWLPSTFPGNPISTDFYVVAAFAPMLVWDLIRNRTIHPAYLIWAAVYVPFSLLVNILWNSPWWQGVAPRIMGV